MARSRLSLVLVLLFVAPRFLNASHNASDSSSQVTQSPEQNLTSLLCVTFLDPLYKEVKLVVQDSEGRWDFTVALGDCAANYTEVLKVQAMNGDDMKINLKTSLGDCDMTCLRVRNQRHPTLVNVTRFDKKKEVKCVKATLPPFQDSDVGLCNTNLLKPIKQSTTASTTELPLSLAESSAAPAKTKPTSPVLVTVLGLELVATCVMAALVVWVVRSRGNSGVTPATTDVRRNSNQDEVYICENDLYEPFTGPPAAQEVQATGAQA